MFDVTELKALLALPHSLSRFTAGISQHSEGGTGGRSII